jgi:hypothetical protein
MREMFVPKRNEMRREEYGILQTNELHYVYGTVIINRIVTSRDRQMG